MSSLFVLWAILLVLGVIMGMAARALNVARSRSGTLLFAGLCLTPWALHHRAYINTAITWLAQEYASGFTSPVSTIGAGPLLVAVVGAVLLSLPANRRWLLTALPMTAMLITWIITVPLVVAEMPDGRVPFDNVPNVWLFGWSVLGATPALFLATYVTGRAETG